MRLIPVSTKMKSQRAITIFPACFPHHTYACSVIPCPIKRKIIVFCHCWQLLKQNESMRDKEWKEEDFHDRCVNRALNTRLIQHCMWVPSNKPLDSFIWEHPIAWGPYTTVVPRLSSFHLRIFQGLSLWPKLWLLNLYWAKWSIFWILLLPLPDEDGKRLCFHAMGYGTKNAWLRTAVTAIRSVRTK